MITFPAAPAYAPADHASHAQTSHAFQIISCCSGVETNWMCSQSLSKWIMLQSVSGLGLDYHLTQARQKKKGEKNAMSTCCDGRVVCEHDSYFVVYRDDWSPYILYIAYTFTKLYTNMKTQLTLSLRQTMTTKDRVCLGWKKHLHSEYLTSISFVHYNSPSSNITETDDQFLSDSLQMELLFLFIWMKMKASKDIFMADMFFKGIETPNTGF